MNSLSKRIIACAIAVITCFSIYSVINLTQISSDESHVYRRKLQSEMKSTQTAYCDELKRKSGTENGISVTGLAKSQVSDSGFRLAVHETTDLVSINVGSATGWQPVATYEISMLLHSFANANRLTKDKVAFLDIGANVGWFTLYMSTLGFETISFEPMYSNLQLLRRSLCFLENTSASGHVTLYPYGLGENTASCDMYSLRGNFGNGNSACDPRIASMLESKGLKQVPNGHIEVRRLDDVLPPDLNIAVMKIDVEGFEPYVIAGSKRLLLERPIPFIVCEFTPELVADQGTKATDFISMWQDAGYSIRIKTFRSTPLHSSQAHKLIYYSAGEDIMLTHYTAEPLLKATFG